MAIDWEPDGAMVGDGTRSAGTDAKLLRSFAVAQTPRQQEIARSIYSRRKAGDSVDDVKDLIAKMSQVITEERRERTGGASGNAAAGR
jgi:hypothetical protein